MKVLHVVDNLNRGAVENWLVRMLVHADKRGLDVDWAFYCVDGESGRMDDLVRGLGARVMSSPVPRGRKLEFVRALRAELARGHYDVLHCHHDLVSAVYLVAAVGLPIGQRIVHVHNADEVVLTPSPWKQLIYRPLMRCICLTLSDRVVGISNHTLETFLAGRPSRDKDVVHYYGVEPSVFERAEVDRLAFRRRLGLAEDCRILLFAGRMVPEKNPVFAVDILAELHRLDPQAVGVFVGSGSLEEAAQRRGRELELDSVIRHLGWRDDIPEIMCCCDWFILPRLEHPMEGFGIAIVEAQLAGLRLLLSDGVPDDPLLPTASFRRLPPAEPKAWAKAAIELLNESAPLRADALAALEASPMNMDRALAELLELHR